MSLSGRYFFQDGVSVALRETPSGNASLGHLARGHWRRTMDGSVKIIYSGAVAAALPKHVGDTLFTGGDGVSASELIVHCDASAPRHQAAVTYVGEHVPGRHRFVLRHPCACPNACTDAAAADEPTTAIASVDCASTDSCQVSHGAVATLDDDARMLMSDMAALELFVAQGWEGEMSFTSRQTRQFQSAVRSLMAAFYALVESSGLADTHVLRSPEGIKAAVDVCVDQAIKAFAPRGLSSTERTDATTFLEVQILMLRLHV